MNGLRAFLLALGETVAALLVVLGVLVAWGGFAGSQAVFVNEVYFWLLLGFVFLASRTYFRIKKGKRNEKVIPYR